MKSFTKTLLSGLTDFRSVRPTWLSAQKLFRRSIVLRDSLFGQHLPNGVTVQYLRSE